MEPYVRLKLSPLTAFFKRDALPSAADALRTIAAPRREPMRDCRLPPTSVPLAIYAYARRAARRAPPCATLRGGEFPLISEQAGALLAVLIAVEHEAATSSGGVRRRRGSQTLCPRPF